MSQAGASRLSCETGSWSAMSGRSPRCNSWAICGHVNQLEVVIDPPQVGEHHEPLRWDVVGQCQIPGPGHASSLASNSSQSSDSHVCSQGGPHAVGRVRRRATATRSSRSWSRRRLSSGSARSRRRRCSRRCHRPRAGSGHKPRARRPRVPQRSSSSALLHANTGACSPPRTLLAAAEVLG